MYEHVFKKREVGFCGNPDSGGLYIQSEYHSPPEYVWFTANVVYAYSNDNYGLQGE